MATSTVQPGAGPTSGPPCEWDHCEQPAKLAVLVGPAPDDATLDGWFCVPHAALASADARARSTAPTWFDGVRTDRPHEVRTARRRR